MHQEQLRSVGESECALIVVATSDVILGQQFEKRRTRGLLELLEALAADHATRTGVLIEEREHLEHEHVALARADSSEVENGLGASLEELALAWPELELANHFTTFSVNFA